MNCPKCGVEQAAGAECISCGIIFDRWRDPATRDRSAEVYRPPAVETVVPDAREGLAALAPRIVIGVILVAALLVGMRWTLHRRALRAATDPGAQLTAELDAINIAGLKKRGELRAANRHEDAVRTAIRGEASELPFPSGLDEKSVRQQIEQCSEFARDQRFKVPRYFHRDQREELAREYPALGPLQRSGAFKSIPHGEVIELVPDAPSYGWVQLSPDASEYEILLGGKRVDELTVTNSTADMARFDFTWNYEQRTPADQLSLSEGNHGYVMYALKDGTWSLTSGWMSTGKDDTLHEFCR